MPQRDVLVAVTAWLLLFALAGSPTSEVVKGRLRAVTIEVGQRRQFLIPGLETVTGSSGRCVEDGVDPGAHEALWIEASCAGVRTILAWKRDATRVLILACAEDPSTRTPALLKRRQQVQKELQSFPGLTACVRNGAVELHGWFESDAQAARAVALEKRYAGDVRNLGERLSAEE